VFAAFCCRAWLAKHVVMKVVEFRQLPRRDMDEVSGRGGLWHCRDATCNQVAVAAVGLANCVVGGMWSVRHLARLLGGVASHCRPWSVCLICA
jgi:hypothetical protein